MNFNTKANNMFRIIGKYKSNKAEVIDSASSLEEAYKLLLEYKLAFSNKWVLGID